MAQSINSPWRAMKQKSVNNVVLSSSPSHAVFLSVGTWKELSCGHCPVSFHHYAVCFALYVSVMYGKSHCISDVSVRYCISVMSDVSVMYCLSVMSHVSAIYEISVMSDL